MQDDPPVGAAQDGAASEDHGAQRGWLPISSQACGALKLGEQVEEQQNTLEGGLGDEELIQAETVRTEVLFEFGNAVLHAGAVVVVAPDLFLGVTAGGDEEMKGVARHINQLHEGRNDHRPSQVKSLFTIF
ncbi:MAG: hypothetical protein ACLGRW_01060 [Acidobacteriota bacterium]